MDEYGQYFYGTLPEDTQNFNQVLRGVGRSLSEIGRSTQYLPYDILGAPVDLATMVMRPFGYQTQTPVGGSDWLINLARQYGVADQPTGSGIETATRLATGVTSPLTVPRAIGRFAQGLERTGELTTEQANRAADALVRRITGNPQATAPGVIQETSMPFMQAVAPKAPGLLAPRSELGFYSALEEAVGPLQNKGTGTQFLAQLEKTPGVKPEEIKWTGLDDFLKSRQNVTKAEVQDYLAQNRVNLQEVRLGNATTQWNGNTLYQDGQPLGKILDTYEGYKYAVYGGSEVPLQSNNLAGAVREAEQISGLTTRAQTAETKPKFSSYTLPGGENYREILLTLPKKPETIRQLSDGSWFAQGTSGSEGFYGKTMEEAIERFQKGRASSADFQSSHFSQPNILAHMRVNDRVVDGKKTLFIEEVQSDWHQAGRKKGYGPQTETTHEAYYTTSDGQRVSLGFGRTQEEAAAAVDPGWRGVVDVKFDTQTKKVGEGVPDAPFKTTWHELTLKRAIQEAAEKGYDKIAFTTGKTQAERYDLSKQVDSLLYSKNPDGTYRVSAQVQGRGQMLGESIPEANLADYVGKEVAEKMSKGIGKQTEVQGRPIPGQWGTPKEYMTELSGEGLKVGGEGMKGFYDNILPKSLDKLGKKFDVKVGKTMMDGTEVWSMDITPKMRESVLTKGQPLFAATPAIPAVGLLGDEGE